MYDKLYLKTHTFYVTKNNLRLKKKLIRYVETHQVNDKTCKITNNKASPKFFHCEKKRERLGSNTDINPTDKQIKLEVIISIFWRLTHPESRTESQNKTSLKQ